MPRGGGATASSDDSHVLTFEQQQSLIRLQVEADERRAQLQAEAEQRQADAARAVAADQLRLVQAQIDLATAQAAIPVAQPVAFRVTDAIRMVPAFDEHDIDSYMSNFEKLASSQNWPRAQWAAVLTPLLKGAKPLRALNRLRPEQVSDYDVLKKAILDEYELVPEAYRNRFRTCVKRQGDSFSDFNQFMCNQFDRWLASVDATNNIDVLKNVMCIEQFMSKCPDDIRQYLLDKGCKTSHECAKRADEYVTMHKTMRKSTQSHTIGKSDVHSSVKPSDSGAHKVNDRSSSGVSNKFNNYNGGSNDHKFQKLCFTCHKPGHVSVNCPTKADTRAKSVNAVSSRPIDNLCLVEVVSRSENVAVTDGVGQYVFPVCFYDDENSKCVSALGFRDSGAEVTLLKSGAVADNFLVALDRNLQLEFANGSCDRVPMFRANVATAGVCGEMCVGLVPESYKFPCNAQILIGNDYGVKLCGAVTRSQTRAVQSGDSDHDNVQVESQVNMDSRPSVQVEVQVMGDSSVQVEVQEVDADLPQLGVGSEFGLDVDATKLAELQQADETLKSSFAEVKSSEARNVSCYYMRNGLLVRKFVGQGDGDDSGIDQIVIPYCLRGKVLSLAHSVPASGHFGVGKTRKRVLQYFYWPGIVHDIQQYCKTCEACQRLGKAGKATKAPLMLPPIVEKPFGRVSIDIVGPLSVTSSNNRFVLTIVDHATRWCEAYPIADHKAVTVARAFSDFVSRFGIPDEVLHDLGSDFTSELFTVLLSFYGVTQLKCSVAHPQTNTVVERFHRTLKAMLTAYVYQCKGEWDQVLCHVLFALREVPVAEYGFSPYEMLFGRHVRGPLSIVFDSWWESGENQASPHVIDYMLNVRENVQNALDTVHCNQAEAQQKAKVYYDKKARAIEYGVGDKVLVLQTQPGKPLTVKYVGPYSIVKKVSPVDYLVNFAGRRKENRIIHSNLLRKYNERSEFVGSVSVDANAVQSVADEEEEVEPTLLDTPVPVNFVEVLREKTAHLSDEQGRVFRSMVNVYSDVISDRPGCLKGYEHTIKTKAGAEPVKLSPYRMSPQQQAKLKVEIDQLLAEGLIEHSDSEWSSPTILVPKPGGAVRCVIDYRQVNKKVIDNVFPIRRIEDLIEKIGKSKFLTKLDLSKGFHQVLLDVGSRPITAFCTPFGQYHWLRLPFGLKTSPMNFSSRLSKVLDGLDAFCCAYIDDIVIGSDTWDEHVSHVSAVLGRLRDAGLTVKLAKCEFACQSIECVGHRVGQGVMSPKEAKVKALLEAPRPKGKRDLQRLLGLANYYRKYIPNYSEIVLPLTEMMSKNVKFVWNEAAERSFVQVKERLTSIPVLAVANFDKPFVLFVDASNYCVGACLAQKDKCDVFKPVCYFSRKLSGAQKNYSTSDKEGLALVLAVRAFRSYLSDRVIVFTDHEPLRYMNTMAPTNQRLLRWCLELQAYDIDIQHIAGKNNVIADYLSRPCDVVNDCAVQSDVVKCTTSDKVSSSKTSGAKTRCAAVSARGSDKDVSCGDRAISDNAENDNRNCWLWRDANALQSLY